MPLARLVFLLVAAGVAVGIIAVVAYATFGLGLALAPVIGGLLGVWFWRTVRREWKAVTFEKKREKAVRKAVAAMPMAERLDFLNDRGRYREWYAIPRQMPRALLTAEELARWRDQIEEFSPDDTYITKDDLRSM